MNIKELFKSMEKANQFAKMVGEEPYIMWMSFDGYYGMKFESWKEFDEYVKNEYAKWYVPSLYKQEIELDSKGCADVFFECDTPTTPYDGKKFEGSVQVAICKKDY